MKPGNIAAIRKAPAQRMDQVCSISHSSVNGMCQPECLTGEKLSARCPGSPGLKLAVLTSAKPQLPRNGDSRRVVFRCPASFREDFMRRWRTTKHENRVPQAENYAVSVPITAATDVYKGRF